MKFNFTWLVIFSIQSVKFSTPVARPMNYTLTREHPLDPY